MSHHDIVQAVPVNVPESLMILKYDITSLGGEDLRRTPSIFYDAEDVTVFL